MKFAKSLAVEPLAVVTPVEPWVVDPLAVLVAVVTPVDPWVVEPLAVLAVVSVGESKYTGGILDTRFGSNRLW